MSLDNIKNILVTGGAGFIGSTVVKNLVSKGKNVLNIDCLTYAGNLDSIKNIEKQDNYFFKKIDVCDQLGLAQAFDTFKPQAIMHLAAESHVDNSIKNPLRFLETNIIGTYNLLETSRKYFESLNYTSKRLFRFHHISTDEVYGDLNKTSNLFTEETPYNPSSPYSASKASSDHLVRSWHRTYGLPILITNCSNNYGPFQYPEKFIPKIIINLLKGINVPIYGDGSQVRDWLYVEDHAEGLLRVLSIGEVGETYSIGGHNEKKSIEIVNTICKVVQNRYPNNNKKFTDYIEFVSDRPGHDLRYAIDASKIKNNLKWVPDETFESGIKKTIYWYIENEKWWSKL